MLLETDVSSEVYPELSRFLSAMRKGAHALTYLDLRKMWGNLPFPFRQVRDSGKATAAQANEPQPASFIGCMARGGGGVAGMTRKCTCDSQSYTTMDRMLSRRLGAVGGGL